MPALDRQNLCRQAVETFSPNTFCKEFHDFFLLLERRSASRVRALAGFWNSIRTFRRTVSSVTLQAGSSLSWLVSAALLSLLLSAIPDMLSNEYPRRCEHSDVNVAIAGKECKLLLMIEFLHDLMCQNHRNYGSVVCMGSCRIYIINSSVTDGVQTLGC